MKELFLTGAPLRGEIRDVDIPVPQENEVLIKVIATDSNPKDWKASKPEKWTNQGDDIAGIVHKIGSAVFDFKEGDRVAALHQLWDPYGAHAEYAIAPSTTTFSLPSTTTFEEGATIPLAAMTAALALYQLLNVPPPWRPVPKGSTFPLVIYGGASAVGAFALKFAKLSNCNPIITIAGQGIPFVESLKVADAIVDYRAGNVADKIKTALGNQELLHAFDAICAHNSWKHILEVMPHDGNKAHINMVDPPHGQATWPPKEMEGVKYTRTFVASAYGRPYAERSAQEALLDRDFAYVMYRYISLLLQEGKFSGHPFEVLGGLGEVARGTQMLFENKVSSKKLVYRVADTPGS